MSSETATPLPAASSGEAREAWQRALEPALELARVGRLYPSIILHGASDGQRRWAALQFARTLQCERSPEERPCNTCRHCRRLSLAGVEVPAGITAAAGTGRTAASKAKGSGESEPYHPDLAVLERDLKTSTSVEAVKTFVRGANVPPFEARGQVFIIASAESLTGQAANALLKALEEPHDTAPRHFLLLAPSQFDLLQTLRSRSLALFLGPGAGASEADVEALAGRLAQSLAAYSRSGAGIHLLALAAILADAGDFKDARSGVPWAIAARAVLVSLSQPETPAGARRRLLALAEALLRAPELRLRGIPADRVLEGLVARHLFSPRGEQPDWR